MASLKVVKERTVEASLELRAVTAVIADQCADQAGQREPGADLEREPRRRVAIDADDLAADTKPERARERRQEQHDHEWVMPRLAPHPPDGVVGDDEPS